MNDETPETVAGGEVAVYEDAGGEVRVDVRLDRETVWLTQRQMAEVFDSTPENVLMHLRNIFASGELEAEATTKEFLAVRTEGRRRVRRRLKHYNLDAIISVGYRVNTRRGVRFRQWATHTLHGHLVQGFTVNERRLAERGLREARETLDLLRGRFATRPWWTIPDRRCWTASRVTPIHGGCCWNTTRTGWRRRPARGFRRACSITTGPSPRSRSSGAI
ncbi:MAG: virulence RhuM family protein [Rhodospirillaceae bacterium]|nr:virulence RhuM family protein [Rhodospirillaceae bacterium]